MVGSLDVNMICKTRKKKRDKKREQRGILRRERGREGRRIQDFNFNFLVRLTNIFEGKTIFYLEQ